MGRVVNTTISQAPITFVEWTDGPEPLGYVAHCERRVSPVPFQLVNGHYLFLYQRLGLRRDERFLTTLEYKYAYQATANDDSWIFRYEYQREPDDDYEFPLSHLHVNATPETYCGDKKFAGLHLPAGERVTIESVVRHLICEQGIKPISPQWEAELEAAETAFTEIQKMRVLDPAPE